MEQAPSRQRRPMLGQYLRIHCFSLTLISLTAWVANYLHFTNFGLYEDDWFFLAFPFLVTPREWMVGSLADQFSGSHFQGRPLQMILGYTFAELGALTNSLALDYLVAYLLFVGSAILMFEVLRRRFSILLSTLAALLFVLSPLYTLHQFLNGQLYSFGPAFIFVFTAMLLYQRERLSLSYLFAVCSLFCYESIFFLYLGAPLLSSPKPLRTTWRAWLRHLIIFVTLVASYFAVRKLLAEARISSLPAGASVATLLLKSSLFHTLASFASYLYAILRVHEASLEAWVYACIFVSALVLLFRRHDTTPSTDHVQRRNGLETLLLAAIIGSVFLIMGYALSYFILLEPTPHFHATDRDTRISVAASFGSSLFVAALLTVWVRLFKSRFGKVVAYATSSLFFLMMFLYSFVLQQDYVEDWQEQRLDAAQVMSLTPDVERDSLIVLEVHVPGIPFFTSARRRRAIGMEKTLYEWEFPTLYSAGQPWPRLFVVHSDGWKTHLKEDSDGLIGFTEPVFEGRWYPASGNYRYQPGRFIFLEEIEPGCIVRHSEPLMINGHQVIQQAPSVLSRVPLWASLRQTALTRQLFPDFAWKSVAIGPRTAEDSKAQRREDVAPAPKR